MPLTLDVMLAVLEVWQAILVKKLDLDSSWVKQSMSEGARNLLKVLFFTVPAVFMVHLCFVLFTYIPDFVSCLYVVLHVNTNSTVFSLSAVCCMYSDVIEEAGCENQ